MLDLLFFLLISVLAALVGAAILRLFSLQIDSRLTEAILYLPLGYLIIAYLVAALGLLGVLTAQNVLVGLGILLVVGLVGRGRVWGAVREAARRGGRAVTSSPRRWMYGFLVVWAAMMLLGALVWPDSRDWDGLAEHLAMAKLWAQAGNISPLWYEHHSQFPATVQMLYTLAHLFRGPVAAKLFHFAYGMLGVGAVFLLTRRHISRPAAPWAAIVVATTPVYTWLWGVAYVDLAMVAYLLLSVHFLLLWIEKQKATYIVLSGILGGAAMAVKMQSIVHFGVIALIALYVLWRSPQHCRARCGRHVGLLLLVALIVAGPWYVKSWVITGNPVYPFAYSIFGGKHWSAAQAQWYHRHQQSFGMGELPSRAVMRALPWWKRPLVGPREPHKLLVAPVNLTLWPEEFTVAVGKVAAVTQMSVGPLYLIFVPLLLIFSPRPGKLKILLIMFAILWLWWLYSMQLTRYLLPTLMLLAPAAGYGIYRSLRAGIVLRVSASIVLGGWLVAVVLFNWLVLSAALPAIGGQVSWDSYLRQSLDVYEASQYINDFTAADAKIITYGEPRCYYLQREYLWGDWHYHQMIVYDRMEKPEELMAAYQRLGITHVLINRRYFGASDSGEQADKRLLAAAIQAGHLKLVQRLGAGNQYLLFEVIAQQ